MKGGREEKVTGPLFPRLHVNDADKGGGPRAPPRNKMALYEQFSIPSSSQRFNPGGGAHNKASSSSSQGCGHERSVFSSSNTPPQAPEHSTKKDHTYCSDGMNVNAIKAGSDRKSGKHGTTRMVVASGDGQSAAQDSSFCPQIFPNANDSCRKKLKDEEDFKVPTFTKPGTVPCSEKNMLPIDKERIRALHSNRQQKSLDPTCSSSIQVPSSHVEHSNFVDLMSRQQGKNNGKQNAKETLSLDEYSEKLVYHLETGEKATELSNYAKPSSNQECAGDELGELGSAPHGSGMLCQESSGMLGRLRRLAGVGDTEQEDASKARSGSCSKLSHNNRHRSPNVAGNPNVEGEDKDLGSLEKGEGNRNREFSETTTADSVSGLDISPDDVVGVIGPKHFWKARRAIVNQQRVFAIQVFELHKLIKVQKLISGSPHLLLEDSSYQSKSPSTNPARALLAEYTVTSHPQIIKQKEEPHKLNSNSECPTENMAGIPLLLPGEDGLNKEEPAGQFQRNGPYSGNPPSMPLASDNKLSPWCFHPPSNQWLIPVMSPSEGLMYKPYAGPYPPPVGFMAPVYGGCSPLSLPQVAGDFVNAAYAVPFCHQQQNTVVLPGAFPSPYAFPVVNPVISCSAVEQMRPSVGVQPDTQAELPSQGSRNISNSKRVAFSKFPASKGSDLQGSTSSNTCEMAGEGRDALPLFPMTPVMDSPGQPPQAHDREDQTHAIKVVPHNPRSALESAARIFRSIQKERRQYDSVNDTDL